MLSESLGAIASLGLRGYPLSLSLSLSLSLEMVESGAAGCA